MAVLTSIKHRGKPFSFLDVSQTGEQENQQLAISTAIMCFELADQMGSQGEMLWGSEEPKDPPACCEWGSSDIMEIFKHFGQDCIIQRLLTSPNGWEPLADNQVIISALSFPANSVAERFLDTFLHSTQVREILPGGYSDINDALQKSTLTAGLDLLTQLSVRWVCDCHNPSTPVEELDPLPRVLYHRLQEIISLISVKPTEVNSHEIVPRIVPTYLDSLPGRTSSASVRVQTQGAGILYIIA